MFIDRWFSLDNEWQIPTNCNVLLNRLCNIYKYFGITSIIHALDYKSYVNKLLFFIFYSIILFTVLYFDSATAGEIKRGVYNILVKQSYIHNTSVSLVFVGWSGICVCTCVRAHAHTYVYIYIYVGVCVACVFCWWVEVGDIGVHIFQQSSKANTYSL
jgi:hypothetical protein